MADNNSDIFEVNLADFDEKVIQASQQRPILVDLWAEWCPPCLAIAPILEKVITELEGAVALAKLEVDEGENMKIAGQYKVRGFPTIILFQNGVEQARFSSARNAQYILDFIDEYADIPL